jgi:hypothetical protein
VIERESAEDTKMSDVEDKDAAAKAAENRDSALELRLHRMWKHDIDCAYRSQLQDVLSHLESSLPSLVSNLARPILDAVNKAASTARNDTTEALNKHQARVSESIAAAQTQLESRITAIVVKVLKEYQVTDADGNLNPHAVAYAISRINK